MNNSEPKPVSYVCKNCEFWKHEVEGESRDEFGSCRRFPPTPVCIDEALAFLQPSTEWKDSCGEFRVRVDA